MITNLLNRFFPKNEERILFLGLDASGRTTTLYKLKLNEVVTTIPTIGFNVETITYKNRQITAWDVGGCDKIRPLWRHYFQNTDAWVWFVDSNDRERMDQSKEEFYKLIEEEELHNLPVLIFANKQDLPNSMSSQEIWDYFEFDNVNWCPIHIQGCSAISDLEDSGIKEGFDWLDSQYGNIINTNNDENNQKNNEDNKKELSEEEQNMKRKEEMFGEWLSREDEPDELFLQKLSDYSLDQWDHRTHIRIAWLILNQYERRIAIQKIFDGIKNFIENSVRTKRSRGTTFHATLTYFWIQIIDYARYSTNNPHNSFQYFLLSNPQLINGGMFLHYYTKDHIMRNQEAREHVVLPDKRPLPSIISDIKAIENRSSFISLNERAEKKLNENKLLDDEFIHLYLNNNLNGWNHEYFLRILWILLMIKGRNSESVDYIMNIFQEKQGDNFHFTFLYSWIQLVTLAIVEENYELGSLNNIINLNDNNIDEKDNDENENNNENKNYSFELFKLTDSYKYIDNEFLLDEFFNESTLYSDDAKSQIVFPDKKSFPSRVRGKVSQFRILLNKFFN